MPTWIWVWFVPWRQCSHEHPGTHASCFRVFLYLLIFGSPFLPTALPAHWKPSTLNPAHAFQCLFRYFRSPYLTPVNLWTTQESGVKCLRWSKKLSLNLTSQHHSLLPPLPWKSHHLDFYQPLERKRNYLIPSYYPKNCELCMQSHPFHLER